MWKNNACIPYILLVIHKYDRFMPCNISILSMNCSFVTIFIYAPPSYVLRQFFWEELITYLSTLSSSFIVFVILMSLVFILSSWVDRN